MPTTFYILIKFWYVSLQYDKNIPITTEKESISIELPNTATG